MTKSEKPTIDVALVTWPNHHKRVGYFCRTVDALMAKLRASEHELRWHCSAEAECDPEQGWWGAELDMVCQQYEIELSWRQGPANLGANMNAALRLGNSPTVFLVQDDWRLLESLDLSPGAEFLESHGEVDLLRYSYPDVDHMRPTFGDYRDGWRQIDLAGLWPYGDDPHLRRRDFMDKWGWYLEGDVHGTASADMMGRLVEGGAVITAADRCYFEHFGDVTSVINDTRDRRVRR